MKLVLNTDGGARGNPGPGAIGIVLRDIEGGIIFELGKYIGNCTNNEAEYQALIEGIKVAIQKGATELECNLDSELVVKQLTGIYKVKEPRMQIFWQQAKELELTGVKITYKHVARSLNKEADKLVNSALDAAR